jgi:YidC/Oxa1 family membrane protein insertase
VSSSRNLSFSLWGSSKPSTPAEESQPAPEAATPTPAPEPVQATATPVTDAAQSAATPPIANDLSVPTTEVDVATLERLVNGEDLLNMQEGIGYFNALGLDYGNGPTSLMLWVLEHVHVWSGLGWAGSIMATALLLRSAMFYPQVKAQRFSAKMNAMRKDPRSDEAMKMSRDSLRTQDQELRARASFLNTELRKEYGVKYKEMLWSFGQIPFSFGLFRAVSGIATLPVPSLENTSFYWIPSLAAADPYYILPAVGTALMVSSLMITTKSQPQSSRKMTKNLAIVFGGVGFVATSFFSAAVNLMAAALGGGTVITALILNSAIIRRRLGLPAIVQEEKKAVVGTYSPPRNQATGFQGVQQRLTRNLNEVKSDFTESIQKMTGTTDYSDQERAEIKRKEKRAAAEVRRREQAVSEFEQKYKKGVWKK